MSKDSIILTAEQVELIHNIKNKYTHDIPIVRKCNIVLYISKGISRRDVTDMCGCSREYVRQVINRFNKFGVDYLESTSNSRDCNAGTSYFKDPISSDTELSEDIEKRLLDLYNDSEQRKSVRRKAYIVLSICKGVSVEEIANNINKSSSYVNNVCVRFANRGMYIITRG